MHKDPIQPLFTGQRIVKLTSCHSTNQVAADLLAEEEVEDGTLVICDRQTAGRGQRGNLWESQPGQNLTISVILKPKFLPVSQQFDLTVVTSLALVKCLQDSGLSHPLIKWPNDIIYHGSKIAGILIENSLRAQLLESSILGIGLNVNQEKFQVSGATSIRRELGKSTKLEDILASLTGHLNQFYSLLKCGESQKLRMEYLNHLMWLDELRTFKNVQTNATFSGLIKGISSEGRLIIASNQKELQFDFKQVVFLK